MSNPTLIKSFNAGGAIGARTIVKAGANDYDVLAGAGSAVTEKLLGVTTDIAAASGERVDVIIHGIAEVKLGGTVARGDPITSDASGQGVVAAPTTGANVRILGFAVISGVSGDVIPVIVSQGLMQG